MIITYFNKLLAVLIFLLVIFAGGVGVISYWLLWPYEPFEVHSIEILNANKTVQAGSCLSYHIKWTKHTDKQGKVNRYFVNGWKHPIDDFDGVLGSAPKGPGEADIFVLLPETTPAGKGRMQFVVSYPMNPVRIVVAPKVPAYSDEFTVTSKPVKGQKGDKGAPGAEGKGHGYSIFGDVNVKK